MNVVFGAFTDEQIQILVERFGIIQPFNAALLSPCSYDLRAGKEVRSRSRQGSHDLAKAGDYFVECGECITLDSLEELNFRDEVNIEGWGKCYIGAHVLNKHRLVGFGLFHPGTSVDPGFKGPLALTLFNMGNTAVRIRHHDPICNVIFFPVAKPRRLYGIDQTPSVREGSTDFSLIVDRAGQKTSDDVLSKMYGTPIARLYERVAAVEDDTELFHLRREEKKREEKRTNRGSLIRTLFTGLVAAIVGGIVVYAVKSAYEKSNLPQATEEAKKLKDNRKTPSVKTDK